VLSVLTQKVQPEVVKTPLQILLSGSLEPPSSTDAPLYTFPPNTMVLISEEAQPSYTTLYRGNVSNTQNDVDALEVAMPMWLAEYLLLNRTPASAPLAKLSFVLMPWNKDPDVEPLPELLNTFVFVSLKVVNF
jgi:WD repeat-containing protein 48